jgi:hypothetical protein
MPDFKKEGDLVCEALVREIYHAKRWTAIVEAWMALLSVREMQKNHRIELEHFCTHSAGATKEVEK